jgi:hypothetical protein
VSRDRALLVVNVGFAIVALLWLLAAILAVLGRVVGWL